MTPCCGGRGMGPAKLKLSWRAGCCPARIGFTTPPLPPPCILGGCGALKRLTLHWGGSCCRWRGELARKLSRRGMPGGRAGPRAFGAPLQQHEEGSPDLYAFFFLLLSVELYLHRCMHACSWVHFRTGGSSDRSRQPGSFEPPSHPPGTELPRQVVLPLHDPWHLALTTHRKYFLMGCSWQGGNEESQSKILLRTGRRFGINVCLYFEVSSTKSARDSTRHYQESPTVAKH